MYVPPRDAYGIRQTVNYGLSTPQTVWNLRSALNVAALNCQGPQYEALIPAYSALLDNNKRELSKVNSQIEAEYRTTYGRTYRDELDNYMTRVYNYYALPNAQTQFCNMALEISNASLLMEPGALETFAVQNLQKMEGVFNQFYNALEQYRIDVAAWDAEYAPPPPIYTSTFAPTAGYGTEAAPVTGVPVTGVPVDGPPVVGQGAYAAPAPAGIIAIEVAPSDAVDGQPDDAAVEGSTAEGDRAEAAPTPSFTQSAPIVFVSDPVVEQTESEDEE
ncbi:hypothetical protein GCM10023115_12030 [Pontixanthobacter gangjinensis]